MKFPCAASQIPLILFLGLALLPGGCRADAGTGDKTVLLLTEDRGILISRNEGKKWKPFDRGLPAGLTPLKVRSDAAKNLYLLTLSSGIYRMKHGTDTWESVNSPKFLSRAPSNAGDEYRKISAFAVNRDNPEQIVLATKYSAYISHNGGRDWSDLPTDGIENFYYITSLAVAGAAPVIYAGTSYKGMFRSTKGRFEKFSTGLPVEKYSTSTYFHEEITEIHAPASGGEVTAGFAFGRGLYALRGSGWKNIPLPVAGDDGDFIHQIDRVEASLYVSADSGIYSSNPLTGEWTNMDTGRLMRNIPAHARPLSLYIMDGSGETPDLHLHISDYRKRAAVKTPPGDGGRKALYSSAHAARTRTPYLIKLIRETGLNSLVIDMKDDFGYVYFPSRNKTVADTGAARFPVNVPEILKSLKENGIYSIARVVVFKDRFLFNAYGNKYAIWNGATGGPWQGNSKEHWVDPHSSFVREYNISLARELQELGFDEIQFDYIRFPTDGATHLCRYRFREKHDTFKSEILTDFLRAAKREISIPISVDIYGFNAWYKCGNWMGQDIEEFSGVIDVICPMDYPSHFGNQFLMEGPREQHPYRILYAAGMRANRHSNGRSLIRPYLQAFNLLSPTWGPDYIRHQVRGAENSSCSGFTFWNAKTDYDMVKRALAR